MALRKPLLWIAWAFTFGLALLCSVIVVKGIVRDRRIGEPVLSLDLSQPSDWRETRFRVWGHASYRLYIAVVNWDSTHVGSELGATFEVAVLTPNGSPAFQQQFVPGGTNLVLPINYADAQLAELTLRGSPLRRWTLQARVLTPDEHFNTAATSVKLYKQRYDPGMAGMMNYVMIFPTGFFLLLAFLPALPLAKHGSRTPLVVTAVWGAAFVILLAA